MCSGCSWILLELQCYFLEAVHWCHLLEISQGNSCEAGSWSGQCLPSQKTWLRKSNEGQPNNFKLCVTEPWNAFNCTKRCMYILARICNVFSVEKGQSLIEDISKFYLQVQVLAVWLAAEKASPGERVHIFSPQDLVFPPTRSCITKPKASTVRKPT